MTEKEYTALLYENSSANGQNAKVKILENKIIVENNDIESIVIDPLKANFSLSGEKSKYLLIKEDTHSILVDSSEVIYNLITSTDKSIHPNLLKIKNELDSIKRKQKSTPIFISVVLISFIIASWFILKISFNYLVDFIVNKIPVKYEEKIGDIALKQLVSSNELNNTKIKSAIEEIGKQLESKSTNNQYKFKFYIVKDNQVNAFALPGGNVVVFTGLLKKADSPEEVAGVLSHELQHVYKRHGLKRLVKSFGLQALGTIFLGDISGAINQAGIQLTALKFDRDEEREADKLGMDLMYESGINPKGMISFFKKLKETEKFSSSLISFLSTHPDTDERIENLQKLYDSRYRINYKEPKKFSFSYEDIKKEIE